MNKNKTTKSKAIIWWTEQVRKGTAQKYRDFYHNGDMLLDDEQIEKVYISEHPQPEEQVKEVDILEENKRLKEVTKLLVDALQPFAKLAYECLNNSNLNKNQDVYAYNNATITMGNLRDVEIALKEANK